MSIPADPRLVELLERATGAAVAGPVRELESFWETLAEATTAVPLDELLAVAMTFTRADAAAMRATGAALAATLAELGPGAARDALELLGPLLVRETVVDVLRIGLHGVAQSAQPGGVAAALALAAHPDAGVRLDATHALYSCAGDPPQPAAVEALIALSRDPAGEVRDWATFGLGTQLAIDGDALREALVARLGDAAQEAREEAAVGLARRGDVRAFEPVRELLEADEVSALTVEAAGHLADERLLRPLLELGEWWEDDGDLLTLAIARCNPVARARFDERAGRVAALVEQGFADRVGGGSLDSVSVERSTSELTSDLEIRFRDAAGRKQEASFELEWLLARPDVQDDPSRAAAVVLVELFR